MTCQYEGTMLAKETQEGEAILDIKAIIFDFDGVIAETESIHREAWLAMGDERDLPLPEGFLDRGIGSTMDKLCWELFEFWERYVPLQEIHDSKAEQFRRVVAERPDVLVPGVIEAIQKLTGLGFPLGIATSSPLKEIEPLLEVHAVSRMFSSIVTLDSVRMPKPDPESYLKSANNLKVLPQECLVFEDSIIGVTAARKAGMHVVGVLTSFKAKDLEPVADTIDDFHQIPNIIKLINASGLSQSNRLPDESHSQKLP